MGKILVVGSLNMDFVINTDKMPVPGETVKGGMFKMGPGGKGFNQCVAAHKAGADATMITKLGRDTFAGVALSAMDELKMNKDKILLLIW